MKKLLKLISVIIFICCVVNSVVTIIKTPIITIEGVVIAVIMFVTFTLTAVNQYNSNIK